LPISKRIDQDWDEEILSMMAKTYYSWWIAPALCWGMCAFYAGAEESTLTFDDHVLPIFRNHCVNCHNADKAKGGLNVVTYSALMSGGSSGPVVLSGDPDGSRLVRVLAHMEEPFMPKDAEKRPDAELEVIKNWIASGLLEFAGDQPKKSAVPKMKISLAASPDTQPEGPPPMPVEGWLDPFVPSARANTIMALAASPWAPLIAIGGHRQILLYHAESHELLSIFPYEEGQPYSLGFSRNGSLLFAAGGVGGQSGRVALWKVETGERVGTVGDELDAILSADLSPDQRFLAIGGTDKRVKVFDLDSGEIYHNIKQHTDWVTTVAFSPDGVLLATGDRNNGLVVWESTSGQEFYKLGGHGAAITALRWSRDSNVLASSSEDGNIKLWDMHTGNQIRSWGAGGAVLGLDFSKDGRLASVARDKAAKIWNAEGGEIRAIREFSDIPTSCVFTQDGKTLLVGDWAGRVSLWNVEDGSLLADLAANPPALAERVADAARVREEAQAALDQRNQEVLAKQEQIQSLNQEMASLRERVSTAETSRGEANQQITDAREVLKKAEEILAQADAVVAELAGVMPEKTKNLEAAQTELQQVQSVQQAAAAALAEKSGQVTRWEQEVTRHATARTAAEESPPPEEPPPAAEKTLPPAPFAVSDEVAAILSSKCYKCHGSEKQKGELRLDSAEAIHAGGESGAPAVIPGKPDESKLIQLVSLPPDDVDIMPSKGDPLTPEQIAVVRAWIESM
jgi:hypothetical protein